MEFRNNPIHSSISKKKIKNNLSFFQNIICNILFSKTICSFVQAWISQNPSIFIYLYILYSEKILDIQIPRTFILSFDTRRLLTVHFSSLLQNTLYSNSFFYLRSYYLGRELFFRSFLRRLFY